MNIHSKIVAAIFALAASATLASPADELLDFKFTDQLGRAVSINDFRGQAVALTFFYTRCPVPEFCPRLSKNFQMAQQTLAAMTNAPANWHLISVSFDPDDSPQTLRRYAESYHYDARHWTFLTGPREKIAGLARAAGAQFTPDGGVITHNFRTIILDANGRLQMVFPTGGDLSRQIVSELLKAAAVKDPLAGDKEKTAAAAPR